MDLALAWVVCARAIRCHLCCACIRFQPSAGSLSFLCRAGADAQAAHARCRRRPRLPASGAPFCVSWLLLQPHASCPIAIVIVVVRAPAHPCSPQPVLGPHLLPPRFVRCAQSFKFHETEGITHHRPEESHKTGIKVRGRALCRFCSQFSFICVAPLSAVCAPPWLHLLQSAS